MAMAMAMAMAMGLDGGNTDAMNFPIVLKFLLYSRVFNSGLGGG